MRLGSGEGLTNEIWMDRFLSIQTRCRLQSLWTNLQKNLLLALPTQWESFGRPTSGRVLEHFPFLCWWVTSKEAILCFLACSVSSACPNQEWWSHLLINLSEIFSIPPIQPPNVVRGLLPTYCHGGGAGEIEKAKAWHFQARFPLISEWKRASTLIGHHKDFPFVLTFLISFPLELHVWLPLPPVDSWVADQSQMLREHL